jgi:outer membrane protein OmpA-like peptidoglycan-associated protein
MFGAPVLGVALAVTACGGGMKTSGSPGRTGSTPTHTTSTPRATPTTVAAPTPATATTVAAPTPPASSTVAAPTPAASSTYTFPSGNGPQAVRIEVLDIHRVGAYVQADLALTCTHRFGNDVCDVALSPRVEDAPGQTGGNENEFDDAGIYLIDPVNDRAYYAVRDEHDNAYASNAAELTAGVTDLDWVRYPAPPASVTSVDVAVPEGPLFEHVPITDSSTPQVPKSWFVDPPAQFDTPPNDTTTTGLTLPDEPLTLNSGNPRSSHRQSGDHTELTLSSDVLFAFDKADLTAKAKAIIAASAAEINGHATGVVKVTGYTDSIGTAAVNIPLSIQRAEAVVKALKPLTPGISYHSAGLGSADPIAPNTFPDGKDDPAGRALNRRVTIAFITTKPQTPTAPPQSGSTGTGTAPATTTSTGSSFTFPTGEGLSPTGTPDAHWRATVQSLTCDGNLAVLQMTVRCIQPARECGSSYDLSGTSSVPPVNTEAGGDAYADTVSGFYLKDAGGTLDIPVRDSYDNPVASALDSDAIYVQPQAVWVYFPAPPADVSTVKLISPGGSAALQIPISGG